MWVHSAVLNALTLSFMYAVTRTVYVPIGVDWSTTRDSVIVCALYEMKFGRGFPSDRSALCAIAQSLIYALTKPDIVFGVEEMRINVSQSYFEAVQSKAPVQSVAVVDKRNPLSCIFPPSLR